MHQPIAVVVVVAAAVLLLLHLFNGLFSRQPG